MSREEKFHLDEQIMQHIEDIAAKHFAAMVDELAEAYPYTPNGARVVALAVGIGRSLGQFDSAAVEASAIASFNQSLELLGHRYRFKRA